MRELILVVIAALVAYVAYELYRAWRAGPPRSIASTDKAAQRGAATAPGGTSPDAALAAGRGEEPRAAAEMPATASAATRPEAPAKAGPAAQPEAAPPARDDGPLFVLQASAAETPAPAPATAGAEGAFRSTLELQQLRREVEQLRAELEAQRETVRALETGMAALKEQVDANTATQSISPEYNEALVFARRGLGVEAIAERCGISVAEADLVRTLAQGGHQEGEGKSS